MGITTTGSIRGWAARLIVDLLLRRIRVGSLVLVEPGGRQRNYGIGEPAATIALHSEVVWQSFLGGSLALADAHADGLWESPDLVALVRLGALNMPALDRLRARFAWALRPVEVFRALRRGDDPDRQRRDIAAHYDLGNDLFSRMLDPTMTYSCAVFERPEMSLEDAQIAKLELVCKKLELNPEDHVLEIGTGWGSFALHAAATRGCRVTTTTISAEQYAEATRRVHDAGLAHLVTVLAHDYRDLHGQFDKLVSIEMIEAVGWRKLGRFLRRCSELLKPDGAMLLQAITIDDRAYAVERTSKSFISTYIFPGGSLPSLAAITDRLARRTDMQAVDVHDITENYAETLRRWRDAFVAHADELAEFGYDERFRRIWTLYLAYCEAGFIERRICDVQMLLAKPGHRRAGGSGRRRSESVTVA